MKRQVALRRRDLVVVGLIVVLISLAVAHVMRLGLTVEPVEWLLLYVLVGFIGGLLFYLVDPFGSQEFKWKGIVNLGGGAAIGASFMFVAKLLTPDGTVITENQFYPAIVPVHQEMILAGGTRLKILEIRSLTDDKLVEVFQGMLTALNTELGHEPTQTEQKELLRAFVRELQLHLGLEPFKLRLEALVEKFVNMQRSDINGDWEDIVGEHLKPRCTEYRECLITFNRVPYAAYILRDGAGVRTGVMLPGTLMRVEGREYEVLTFANPRRKVSEEVGLRRQLFEGLVIGAKRIPGS